MAPPLHHNMQITLLNIPPDMYFFTLLYLFLSYDMNTLGFVLCSANCKKAKITSTLHDKKEDKKKERKMIAVEKMVV
jgi:hypothetical protein